MATVQYFRDKLAGSILELWWHHKNLSFPIYFNINNDIMLKFLNLAGNFEVL
jgi:hypothetical protein